MEKEMVVETPLDLDTIYRSSMEQNLEVAAPKFKKNYITEEQITKILFHISLSASIPIERALIAVMLLFLQGAVSTGAPLTMSVDLGAGKQVDKKRIVTACQFVTGHSYIRRIAEALAVRIGEFAYKNNLLGELAVRINSKFRAENGTNLSDRELAFSSSFSQSIPNLAEITSERLVRLLAEDYQERFSPNRKKLLSIENVNLRALKRRKKRK